MGMRIAGYQYLVAFAFSIFVGVGITQDQEDQAIPVLTYHPGVEHDHNSFPGDLRMLHRLGFKIVPLERVVDWVLGECPYPGRVVALTLDDGMLQSYIDGSGLPGFLSMLLDFQEEVGKEERPDVSLTAFVIASELARHNIRQGDGMLNSAWWRPAQDEGIIRIQNHSWDHTHERLTVTCEPGERRNRFDSINTYAAASCEIALAAATIQGKTFVWPDLFAYPYGQSNAYLREQYFPNHGDEHKTRAAFGGSSRHITRQSDRWNLPRYVSRADWKNSDELRNLLQTGDTNSKK